MNSNSTLQIENLSKIYRLGVIGTGTLSHDLNRWFAKIRGKSDPYLKLGGQNSLKEKGNNDYIWALKDVNFEVERGEVLGLIGSNGAGKSTLLKILSRTTSPTTGRIVINGSIASLLEVGTGFHPELTGKENIYLNGAILGMSKNDITRKMDEIIAFSGIDKHVNTPVKRYSSGMYVRLAFAVAAHLEPDVLVVDEVLAVGDFEFQKKCLGKMKDVSNEGRTVLFVSHNMAALSNLCTSAIVLNEGSIQYPKGNVEHAIQYYLGQRKQKSNLKLVDRTDREGEMKIQLKDIEILDHHNRATDLVISGRKIKFNVYYKSNVPYLLKNVGIAISITRSDGFLITVLANEIADSLFCDVTGEGFFSCELEKLSIMSGSYSINLMIRQNGIIQDWIQEAAFFSIEEGDFYNTGKVIPQSHKGVLLEQKWKVYDI